MSAINGLEMTVEDFECLINELAELTGEAIGYIETHEGQPNPPIVVRDPDPEAAFKRLLGMLSEQFYKEME